MKIEEDPACVILPFVTEDLITFIQNVVRRNPGGSFLIEPGDRKGEYRIFVEEKRRERKYALNLGAT